MAAVDVDKVLLKNVMYDVSHGKFCLHFHVEDDSAWQKRRHNLAIQTFHLDTMILLGGKSHTLLWHDTNLLHWIFDS